MTIAEYLQAVDKQYRTGIAREHSYRGDLQQLLTTLCPGVLVTNEPARIACGAPDYILTKKDIPVGYVEAKDINVDIGSKSLKEQFDRYRSALENLIITDYLEFRFYKGGEHTTTVRIAEVVNGKIRLMPAEFDKFTALIKDFAAWQGQTISSPKKLAEMMAGKARLLADVIEKAVTSDEESQANTNLREQLEAFKVILIHDIAPKSFADLYAQTIAYGMFAARLHDPSPDSFSRMEAAQLIPKSNPFLRKLFQSISGYDLDERIAWIVDALADIFRATDIAKLLAGFGKATEQNDPIIHFYETFLGEYDPKLRKARGVWYTPEPVVNFIVRAVDDILKSEFGLKDGLADTSKVKVKVNSDVRDARSNTGYKQLEQEVHRVQILDPATGTGTFLAEVVKQIYKKFEGQQGIWSQYVEEHLIPRLNGFEILMASYAMAHLKLDMLLAETGYKVRKEQRLRVYLTNSLEEHHKDTGTLFAGWLSAEANEANHIKRDTPVMVVMGNPPYSISSSNKGEWIESLCNDYKRGLKDRNLQPLSDDYIKFIRFGQHFIEKNSEGVLAFITNNAFFDSIIHRRMRQTLLETFDTIFILDLHGSSKRKEKARDGSKDENVFDIQQGVGISIYIKHKQPRSPKVLFKDFLGSRNNKYNDLRGLNLRIAEWNQISPEAPYYLFNEADLSNRMDFESNFSLMELFEIGSDGVQTKRDTLFVDFDKKPLAQRIERIIAGEYSDADKAQYGLKNSSSYKLLEKLDKVQYHDTHLLNYLYRPLDNRTTYYDKELIGRHFYKVMRNFQNSLNYGLIIGRQGQVVGDMQWNLVSISSSLTDTNIFYRGGIMMFPLYINTGRDSTLLDSEVNSKPNLDGTIIQKIAEGLGLAFVPEKLDKNGNACVNNDTDLRPDFHTNFAPIDLLDYIYAVLHSPAYRDKYKEFLKIDFPRVPYPKDKAKFRQLVELGSQIRQIHLLKSPIVEQFITTYPQAGDNEVTRKLTKTSPGYVPTSETHGQVWINEDQYFNKVPLTAWEFYIGGYQPAQKWLKDRYARTLSFNDIRHYQKIIVALSETDRLMKEVDEVGVV